VHIGDQRAQTPTGGHTGPHFRREPAELLLLGSIAVVGRVDRDDAKPSAA
jgi:hypothetical protein